MTTKNIAERRKEMNEGLSQDIKEIKYMLATMQQNESARIEREKTMQEELKKLKETINGNGKPGLKTDVQLLIDSDKKRDESDKKRGNNQNAIIIAIVIQIIMMVLTKVM